MYNETSLLYPEFYTDFSHLISIIMSYQYYTLDLKNISEIIFQKYFPSGKIEDHSHMQTVEVKKVKENKMCLKIARFTITNF